MPSFRNPAADAAVQSCHEILLSEFFFSGVSSYVSDISIVKFLVKITCYSVSLIIASKSVKSNLKTNIFLQHKHFQIMSSMDSTVLTSIIPICYFFFNIQILCNQKNISAFM